MVHSRWSCFVLAVLFARGVWAQVPAPPIDVSKLQFEVASVKPNKSGSPNARIELHPGGRLTATNVALRSMMRGIYNVQAYQIIGGPEWLETERFDIEAKADREYPLPVGEDVSPEVQAMLQNLLVDRLKLVARREIRELHVYALTLAKPDSSLGPRLRRTDVDCSASPCGARLRAGRDLSRGVTIQRFGRNLARYLGRVVIDRTNLTGAFDIDLEWAPEQTADANVPSIFTAVQEQLGLRLESTRARVDVLVIESVERPTPD
jgi:uncharacterized protein (TIGR03435 family)